MGTIRFRCGCGARLVSKDLYGGMRMTCPECMGEAVIPKRTAMDRAMPWLVPISCSAVSALAGFYAGKMKTPRPVAAESMPAVVSEAPRLPAAPKPAPDYSRWTLSGTFQWSGEDIRCVAFAPDGRTIAVGGGKHRTVETSSASRFGVGTGVVQLWDVVTREARGRFADPDAETEALAFYPDGSSLAIGDEKKLKVLDAKTGLLRFSIPEAGCSFALNGPRGVIAISRGDNFWDMASGEPTPGFVRRTMNFPVFSLDGALLCTSDAGAWSCATGARAFVGGVGVGGDGLVVFSHDGRFIGSRNGVWPVGGKPLWERQQHGYGRHRFIRGIAFTPDDKFLLCCDFEDKSLLILDSASGKELSRKRPHEANFDFALSPDGQYLVTASVEPTSEEFPIKVWRPVTLPK